MHPAILRVHVSGEAEGASEAVGELVHLFSYLIEDIGLHIV
jgi:hypothetical protein